MDVNIKILTAATEEDLKLLELDTVKGRLGIPLSDGDRDDQIDALILEVSESLAECLERPIARQRYVERLISTGDQRLLLSRAPVETVGPEPFEITDLNAVAIDPATYELEDQSAGMLFREQGWPVRVAAGGIFDRHILAGTESPSLIATYWAGWVTPGMATPNGNPPEDFITMPSLLARAAWHTFQAWWTEDQRKSRATSIRLGKFAVSYGKTDGPRAIPDVAHGLIAKLRI